MRAVTVISDNGKQFETDAEHETKKDNADEEELSAEETAGLASVDPISARAALQTEFAEEWKAAMRTEYDALTKNQTWSVVDKPKDKNIIGCRWVFRTKLNANGSIERRKARLVAKGFSQRKYVDFNETFAPVARAESIRLIMALAVELELEIHQLDFVSAYLNGELDEDLYMEIPEELSNILTDAELRYIPKTKVLKLKKSLYGLKQSGRRWFIKLAEALKTMKFQQLQSDHCVYILKEGEKIIIVAVYVDDVILASNNVKKMNEIKKKLSTTFEMKDLGKIHHCLGVRFVQENGSVSMDQEKYIEEILEKYCMSECKPALTPLSTGVKLSKKSCPTTDDERNEMKKIPYRNLVGALMYLAVSTRPDIAHAISLLGQFNDDYGREHWIAAKRVLRYLQGTKSKKLIYTKTRKSLVGFADADWAANIDDRHSYSGYVFVLGNAAVSWSSRKQKCVALSTTEAEYIALSEGAKEAVHLRRFLTEVIGKQKAVTIFNDNQGAAHVAKDPVMHGRAKHIEIRYHFTREAICQGEITVKYLPTDYMTADILTKGLGTVKHDICVKALGIQEKSTVEATFREGV